MDSDTRTTLYSIGYGVWLLVARGTDRGWVQVPATIAAVAFALATTAALIGSIREGRRKKDGG